MKKYDVTALGELLIDFTESGMSETGNGLVEVNPGGAPCNVLAMLCRLGKCCAFIGKVGKDAFGDLLEDTIKEAGIETCGLKRDSEVHTTLAFVHNYANGERDFSFYRNPGADMMLNVNDLDAGLIDSCRIFHFGTLSLTHESCREATREAVERARRAGAIISFDPNLREPLWASLDDAKAQIAWGLSQCDILKISDNELEFMTGTADFDRGAELLKELYPQIRLLNVTAGDGGSISYYEGRRVCVPAVKVADVKDKTGAGDTFCGCVLGWVLDNGLDDLTEEQLRGMLRFANAAAACVIRRKGALKVMPEVSEIKSMMEKTAKAEDKMIVGADYRLPYFAFGRGEKTFILLPGASMTSILDSENAVKALFAPYAEDYRICVFDVPQDLDSVSGIDRLADIIADAATALGIEKAAVFGASMGGMIGQKLTIRHPGLVRSLTLASSMSRNSELSRKVISAWADISDPEALAKEVNAHVYSEAFYNTYAEAFHALELSATEEGVKRLHNLTRMIKGFNAYDELDTIKCPVYVFAADCDDTLGVQASYEIAQKLGCSITVYKGYSHAVYDELPGFYEAVFRNLK